MRGLSFTVDGELYAVDVTLVQKVARKLPVTRVPSAPAEVIGIANLKGRVVTVLSLSKLFGNDDPYESEQYPNTIVFKSCSGAEDQMGLSIEKPGNLIYIESDAIRSPPKTAETEKTPFLTGVAEISEEFFRIIDIDIIRKKYTHSIDADSSIS